MLFLKDILVTSKSPQGEAPLGEILPIFHNTFSDVTHRISNHRFIIDNYNLRFCKFLTIRPHNLYLIGKHYKIFEHCVDFEWVPDVLIEQIYAPFLSTITQDFYASVERNIDEMNFIHLHIVFFDTSCKEFDKIVKRAKSEFSGPFHIKKKNVFGTRTHLKDFAVKPKRYSINEKHFALLYYMGFDKKSIARQLLLKDSAYKTIYKIQKSENSYLNINALYKIYPYNNK